MAMNKRIAIVSIFFSIANCIYADCYRSYPLNSLGYRDTNEWVKKKDKPRIICLGDSVTQGMCSYVSWPEYLQGLLGNKYEVLNAGVGGNNSLQCLKRLKEHLLEYRPNIIILSIGTNDIDQTVSYNDFKSHIEEMITICKSKHIKIGVTTTSQASMNNHGVELLPDYETDVNRYRDKINGYNKIISSVCTENKVYVIRLDELVSNTPKPIFFDRVHLNDYGSELYAKAIYITFIEQFIK